MCWLAGRLDYHKNTTARFAVGKVFGSVDTRYHDHRALIAKGGLIVVVSCSPLKSISASLIRRPVPQVLALSGPGRSSSRCPMNHRCGWVSHRRSKSVGRSTRKKQQLGRCGRKPRAVRLLAVGRSSQESSLLAVLACLLGKSESLRQIST